MMLLYASLDLSSDAGSTRGSEESLDGRDGATLAVRSGNSNVALATVTVMPKVTMTDVRTMELPGAPLSYDMKNAFQNKRMGSCVNFNS